MNPWIVAVAAPLAISFVLVPLLRRSSWAARLADHPNERSLHTQPTPRVGGIAIMLASIPIAFALSGPDLRWTWTLALGLALVSFVDDLRSLPIAVRLAAHFAAAGLAIASYSPGGEWGFALVLFAVLGIAWMSNLYNFMDGADGLAGGMSVIGFGTYAAAALQAGNPSLALGCAAISFAALGFLAHNFPPARVFMGDAGSIPLGFLAGALGVRGYMDATWPAWFPLLAFSPFVVDATFTLVRRAVRRERIWIAHRSHYYQRLVLSGWSTRRLALRSYGLMAASSASALLARGEEASIQCAILGIWCALYLAVVVAIERRGTLESVS